MRNVLNMRACLDEAKDLDTATFRIVEICMNDSGVWPKRPLSDRCIYEKVRSPNWRLPFHSLSTPQSSGFKASTQSRFPGRPLRVACRTEQILRCTINEESCHCRGRSRERDPGV